MGIINLQDPLVQVKLCREYGIGDFALSRDADESYIAREEDKIRTADMTQYQQQMQDPQAQMQMQMMQMQGQEYGPIAVGPFDNHQLHLVRHLDLYKSEDFETWEQI